MTAFGIYCLIMSVHRRPVATFDIDNIEYENIANYLMSR